MSFTFHFVEQTESFTVRSSSRSRIFVARRVQKCLRKDNGLLLIASSEAAAAAEIGLAEGAASTSSYSIIAGKIVVCHGWPV